MMKTAEYYFRSWHDEITTLQKINNVSRRFPWFCGRSLSAPGETETLTSKIS
jgi:hypothetical protein